MSKRMSTSKTVAKAKSKKSLALASQTGKPKHLAELTTAQVVSYVSMIGGDLPRSLPSGVTYQTYRDLRKDPTIALARSMLAASVLSGSWSIEADDDVPDDMVALIDDTFMSMREQIMEPAVLFGDVDFGWQGYEKVFEEDGGKVILKKLKPLLHDITTIQIEKETGVFAGYKQVNSSTGQDIILTADKCLHIAFRVEGTQWYGSPLLENARSVCTKWTDADAGAATYDKKVAGSHFVIYYPPGMSTVAGATVDNGVVAAQFLRAMEASGSISIPRTIASEHDIGSGSINSEMYSWKIDILQDSGARQPGFVDREKYLDALKVRALLTPERSILEGEFGTKAEAGVHADMAIANMQLVDRHITRFVNWYAVDQVMVLNFGEDQRGKVRLVATPLIDEQIGLIKQIYTAIIANPQGFLEEFGTLDTDAMKDKLGLPKSKEIAQAGDEDDPELATKEGVLAGLTAEERERLSRFIPSLGR